MPAAVSPFPDDELECADFEPDAMATVLYAMFSPSLDQVRICSAGHLPPIIAGPGQPAASADVGPRSAHRRVQPEVPPGNETFAGQASTLL
jgi:hypothetical protein